MSSPWPQKPVRPPRRLWPWLVLAILVGALAIYLLAERFPDALEDQGSQVRIVYLAVLLVFLGGAVAVRIRAQPGPALKSAIAWIGIGAVILVVYSFRDEAAGLKDRLLGELIPDWGVEGDGAISFRAGTDGHFTVEAEVDGTPLRFLVDTGASDVVLTPRDAERLGFDLGALRYTRLYNTANGTVRGAPVTLNRVRLGPIDMVDVHASVNGAAMNRSLLGMSFLARLGSYEVRGDRLTLRP